MSKGRTFTFVIPEYLLDQIAQRALINGRKRNAEVRYLVNLALEYTGEAPVQVAVPSRKDAPWKQVCARFSLPVMCLLSDIAREEERSMGEVIVRLMAYALEESARRDLQVIQSMMGSAAR